MILPVYQNCKFFSKIKMVKQNWDLQTSTIFWNTFSKSFVKLVMAMFNIFSSTHQALRSHLGPFQFESAHQAHWADWMQKSQWFWSWLLRKVQELFLWTPSLKSCPVTLWMGSLMTAKMKASVEANALMTTSLMWRKLTPFR